MSGRTDEMVFAMFSVAAGVPLLMVSSHFDLFRSRPSFGSSEHRVLRSFAIVSAGPAIVASSRYHTFKGAFSDLA